MHLNILRDNREQKPWEFDDFDVDVRGVTLETGDYTLEEFCEHDEERDTYVPSYAIERKSESDLVNSVGSNNERFRKELSRAENWETPMLVLVEGTLSPSRYQQGIFDYTDLTESQVRGIIRRLKRDHNVSFQFAGSRAKAQQVAYETLLCRLRTQLSQ